MSDYEHEKREPLRPGDVVHYQKRAFGYPSNWGEYVYGQVVSTKYVPLDCESDFDIAVLSTNDTLVYGESIRRVGSYSRRLQTIRPHNGVWRFAHHYRTQERALAPDAVGRLQQRYSSFQEDLRAIQEVVLNYAVPTAVITASSDSGVKGDRTTPEDTTMSPNAYVDVTTMSTDGAQVDGSNCLADSRSNSSSDSSSNSSSISSSSTSNTNVSPRNLMSKLEKVECAADTTVFAVAPLMYDLTGGDTSSNSSDPMEDKKPSAKPRKKRRTDP